MSLIQTLQYILKTPLHDCPIGNLSFLMQVAVLKFTVFILKELIHGKFMVIMLSEEKYRALSCTTDIDKNVGVGM